MAHKRRPDPTREYIVELVDGHRASPVGAPQPDLESAEALYKIAASNNPGCCVVLRLGAKIIRRSNREAQ
jgi:hypothetical protein